MATRPSTVPRLRSWAAKPGAGGSDGNERLTASVAVVLLGLLAAEGVTILRIDRLITAHVFIGMLLIPPVALKLASTGYRFASYYAGRREYVAKGPPHVLLRYVIAPAVIVTTITVLATGVAVVAAGAHHGLLVLAHKASFIVWVGAMGLHVLAHVLSLPAVVARDLASGPAPGRRLRLGLVVVALAGGVVLALATLPLAHTWARA